MFSLVAMSLWCAGFALIDLLFSDVMMPQMNVCAPHHLTVEALEALIAELEVIARMAEPRSPPIERCAER
jgi:hypothetical protein